MRNKKYVFVLLLLVFLSTQSYSERGYSEESDETAKKKNTETVVFLTESDTKNLSDAVGLYDGYRDEGKLQVQKNIKKTEEPLQNSNSNEVD